MALYPWRFQADVVKGELDPLVTVFVGPERYVMDDTGNPTEETYVHQEVTNSREVKLSELMAILADPGLLPPVSRSVGPTPPGMNKA